MAHFSPHAFAFGTKREHIATHARPTHATMAKTNKKPTPYYDTGPSGYKVGFSAWGARQMAGYVLLCRAFAAVVALYLAVVMWWIVFVMSEDTPRERLRQSVLL